MSIAVCEFHVHKMLNPMLGDIKKKYSKRKINFSEHRAHEMAGHSGVLWYELRRKRFLLPSVHMLDISIPISKVHGHWKVDNDYAACRADPAIIDELRIVLPKWSKIMKKKLGIKGFEFARYKLKL